jgi:transcriptional regulator with XRE-family HTH domain
MLAFDDLRPLLNPVQCADLAVVLEVTKADRRIAVLLAFADLSQDDWARAAGLEPPTVSRWIAGQNRLPFGGALRLARIVGVDPELLFKHSLDDGCDVRRMKLAG